MATLGPLAEGLTLLLSRLAIFGSRLRRRPIGIIQLGTASSTGLDFGQFSVGRSEISRPKEMSTLFSLPVVGTKPEVLDKQVVKGFGQPALIKSIDRESASFAYDYTELA